MSLLTELYGTNIQNLNLDQVKDLVKSNPIASPEQKKALIQEYATLKGILLTEEDYKFVAS